MKRLATLALCAAVLAPGACDDTAPEQGRRAGQLVQAVARLREAPNEGKAAELARLSALACTGEEYCELQRVCGSGYEKFVSALSLIDASKAAADRPAPRGDPSALVARVREAQRALTGSQAEIERCTKLELKLHQ